MTSGLRRDLNTEPQGPWTRAGMLGEGRDDRRNEGWELQRQML